MKTRKRASSGKQLPRDSVRLVKIAPGENACFWGDCLTGGYICVGWDEVGDLRKFKSKDDFKAAFERHCSYSPSWKGDELWTLMELQPGDKIIANNGLTRVVGVGTVKEPGYKWMPNRSPDGYYHSLFDLQLMGLEPSSMRVCLRPTLKGSEYWKFHNRKIRLPEHSHSRPDRNLLAERYRLFRSG